ncbi:hypothetical protein BCR39DRAFT_43126 [Naematelia encephala]|uniref:Family A G protein-coupled receptor-like protein n=1 Tax=Naematelia encephala TaxID=71784 RepID=A0A1Y2BBN3_9TREE|nr:hypothetical protein BCR39DRAFT_43126 [Naematelia encephala]
MLISDLVIMVWHFTIPRGQRVFHQIAVILLTTAAIAYFCMASDLGFANIATEFSYLGFPRGTYRQIWYVRYIDWTVTTPMLLLELVLASGLPLSDVVTLIFFDLVMIITGLVGSLVESSYKWGFFTFGCAALFYVWYVLLVPGIASAGVLGSDYKRSFTTSTAILSFLWLLYPVAWGLADGASVISPDSEMIFYGILDVLAKPVFCFIHLYSLSKLDLTALQLSSGKFSASAVGAAGYDAEKTSRFGRNPRNSGSTLAAANSTPETQTTPAKRGMFTSKGRYDARQNPVTVHPIDNAPRNGAATAVST